MTPQEEESDQLPEEGQSGAVTEDDPEEARDSAEGNEGGGDSSADEGSRGATGNPDAAG